MIYCIYKVGGGGIVKEIKLAHLYIQVMLVMTILVYVVLFKIEDAGILIYFIGEGINTILSTASFLVVFNNLNKEVDDRAKLMGICSMIMSIFITIKCIYKISFSAEYELSLIQKILQSIIGIVFLMICTYKDKKNINLYMKIVGIISIIGGIIFILPIFIELNINRLVYGSYIKGIIFSGAGLIGLYRLMELNKVTKSKQALVDSYDIQICTQLCKGSIFVWIVMTLNLFSDIYILNILVLVIQIILSLFIFRYVKRKAFIFKSKEIKKRLEGSVMQDVIFASTIKMNNEINRMSNTVESIISKTSINEIDGGLLYIEKIDRNCKVLAKLSHNIIRLNDFENMDYQICFKRIDVVSVVKESVDSMMPYFKSNNIGLEYDIKFRNIYCDINIEVLERVLVNIVSNSIKYNKDGGKVVISLEKDCKEVEIQVKDTGVGINAKDIQNIFTKYSRFNSKGGKNKEGSGLGLAIVKKLVELHNGSIEIKSSLGNGTTVCIRLPIRQ